MTLCSRTDTANSRETYAGRDVTKSCAVRNFCQCGQDTSGSNRVTVELD